MTLEYQRYGRNKNTLVNKTYLNSGEYRRKFDRATDNPKLNKALYIAAKTALIHRGGTELEDMYWFDGITGEIIAREINNDKPRIVDYSSTTKAVLKANFNIVALHTHPSSMPPSADDFNSFYNHGYISAFVICHNGTVFGYYSGQKLNIKLYEMVIGDYLNEGLSEYESQIHALEDLKRSYDIDFWEVK